MAAVDYTDALDASWRIFPLHSFELTANGAVCACGRESCEAAGKHPKASNWQHTQPYDDTQLAYLEDDAGIFGGNQLLDHYGIVVNTSGLLVVDVDGRNGGFESAKKLQAIRDKCGFIVETGSGAGEHWYFKNIADFELLTNHADYKGIDFKSSGFVVGCGSLHKSGHRYLALSGSPAQITDAPAELLELIKRPVRQTFSIEGASVTVQELAEMIKFIKHDEGQTYDRWLAVGMALHHATNGAAEGEELWHQWTAAQGRSDTESITQKWHSFGKSSQPVTQGTLMTWAKEGGYSQPVTFKDDTDWGELPQPKKNVSKVDLLNPPGLVGELTKWINSRCLYPREHLAVAAALQIVGNVAGLNYIVGTYETTLNLITICIAGSRTGKGAIKSAIDSIHYELGLSRATHGKFKSSQELVRNAIYHQPVHYVYDEFGKQLEKLSSASKGGAHYLEDLVAEIMSMYSEANGQHNTSGDLKRELEEMLDKKISAEAKKEGLEQGENIFKFAEENPESGLAKAIELRKSADRGIVAPFLTFFALTEPRSYNAALEKDPWLTTGGFLGRALFFEEMDNVPIAKPIENVYRGMPSEAIMMQLRALLCAGSADIQSAERIERVGEWKRIKWTKEAEEISKQIQMYWHEVAISEDEQGSGMESQAKGAHELTLKVAGILGVANHVISATDMTWAHELVKSITLDKIARTKASEKLSGNPDERGEGLLEALLRYVNSMTTDYCTAGKARQNVGKMKVSLDNAEKGLSILAERGLILKEVVKGGNGKISIRYKKV